MDKVPKLIAYDIIKQIFPEQSDYIRSHILYHDTEYPNIDEANLIKQLTSVKKRLDLANKLS